MPDAWTCGCLKTRAGAARQRPNAFHAAESSRRNPMSLAKKLNLKDGTKIRVIGKPASVDLDDLTTTTGAADAILLFATKLADVDKKAARVLDAARADKLAWIAYPKAKQLGTDLNRDVLWKHLEKEGVQGVRQVSIDDVWSAMRFRPAK